MKSYTIFDRISQSLVVLIFLLTFFILCFFLMKGLDITDEGLYLLASQYPHDLLVLSTSAFYFTHILFKVVGFSVPLFRFASLFLLLFTGMWAGWVTYRVVTLGNKTHYSQSTLVAFICFSGLGTLVYYVWGGMYSPGYNAVIASIINLSGGIISVFYYWALTDSTASRKASLLSVFWGFLIGMALFSKITSAFILFFIAIFWIIFTAPAKKNALFRTVCFISGFFIFVLLFFLTVEKFFVWYQRAILNTYVAVRITGVGNDLIVRSVGTVVSEYFVLVRFFQVDILGFLAVFCYFCFTEKFRSVAKLLLVVVLCFIYLHLCSAECFIGGLKNLTSVYDFYIFWFCISLITVCMSFLLRKYKEAQLVCLDGRLSCRRLMVYYYLLLLTLPYVGAFGTTNPIMKNILMNIAPWFSLYLIWLAGMNNIWPKIISGIILVVICIFSSVQIISAAVAEPYGLSSDIFNQTVVTSVGAPESKIMMDKPTSQCINHLKSMAERAGFKAGDPILAFTDMAGLVFALGGRSPGTPWYAGVFGVLTNNKEYNEFMLGFVPRDVLKKAFILQKMDDLTGMPNLLKFGINFPDDYIFCGEVFWPRTKGLLRLWRPRLISDK